MGTPGRLNTGLGRLFYLDVATRTMLDGLAMVERVSPSARGGTNSKTSWKIWEEGHLGCAWGARMSLRGFLRKTPSG